MFWVLQGSAAPWTNPLSFGDGKFRFETDDPVTGWIIFNSGIDSSDIYFPAGWISPGVWRHVAFTSNSTDWHVYVNGADSVSGTTDGVLNGGSLFIGDRYAAAWAGYNGSIDECASTIARCRAGVWLHYQSEFSKYNSTTYRFYANVTNLSNGVYTYYGWANDSAGNSAYTDAYNTSAPRYLTVASTVNYISGCTNLNVPGATYYLTANITNSQRLTA